MLRSIPFHPNMNLNLSFSIFAISYIRRWTHSREFNAYRYRIYEWDFCCYNFHIFRFSSFRFSGKGEVDVYRMCVCMCFIVSLHCHGIRSSRHQGVSPPTNSPPRNHHATNQLVCALRSHCIMVEIKNRLIYIETRLSAGRLFTVPYFSVRL